MKVEIEPGFEPTDHKLVLLPVDDDGGDLLVHEDEDGGEQGRHDCHEAQPPRVRPQGVDQPTPAAPGWVELLGDGQLWGLDAEDHVDDGHGADGDDHPEVGDETANVGGKEVLAKKCN